MVNGIHEDVYEYKKIIILHEKYHSLIFQVRDELKDKDIWCVQDEKQDELVSLYHMYEFTDNMTILDPTIYNYPNIFNFIKTGILTEKEAEEAIINGFLK